jgi:hypothetical protein
MNKNITLGEVLAVDSFQQLFSPPLSEEAFAQYSELEIILNTTLLNDGGDSWRYIWGSSTFSSQKAYKHLTGSFLVHHVFK